ncbi:MAG TPA: hypothetical protein V6D12_02445 [Candidatus Obscuribacterales bacterium]
MDRHIGLPLLYCMTPEELSPISPEDPNSSQTDAPEEDFEQAIKEIERSLVALKQRYTQVQHDMERQAELQQRLEQVKTEWRRTHLPEMQTELRQIQAQLQEIEVALESCLLSNRDQMTLFWKAFRLGFFNEVFWQVVRFGGLGVVVGWILKSWAK